MSRLVKDIVGDSLTISQASYPTITLTSAIAIDIGSGTFTPTSPTFTLTFTKIGNMVFMDWSECNGTITGTVTGLRTAITIPSTLIPPSANVGDGFYIRPEMTTSSSPLGNPDAGVGIAAEPYLGFQDTPYYLYFGTTSAPSIFSFTLYAGATCYHI